MVLSSHRHAELEDFEALWGDPSAHSSLPAEFDRLGVVSRPTDRAVGPVGFSEHYLYLSHSQVGQSFRSSTSGAGLPLWLWCYAENDWFGQVDRVCLGRSWTDGVAARFWGTLTGFWCHRGWVWATCLPRATPPVWRSPCLSSAEDRQKHRNCSCTLLGSIDRSLGSSPK